ncbi:hypothetical protein M433DRAFT_477446 [Acidomyces richmondensis BFW]|nr:hypothetical protein M433DRAFT_477446 [Acidomyces richmondensis BFW]
MILNELKLDAADAEHPRVTKIFKEAKKNGRPVHVSAPMVRYSKLPFRLLIRDYNVDIAYTPMILAHEFIRSQVARDSDFTTSPLERHPTPDGQKHILIAQFASNEPDEFARAAEMIAPWVDGVDLNCGCPQSWAIKEGIGCSLMERPHLVAEMVTRARSRLEANKSVSVKIRIHKDLSRTIQWVQTLEQAGVDYITVHGRLRSQRSSTPPDYDAIRRLGEHVRLPIIANGDAYSAPDVEQIARLTNADGVMAARGILENPALFAGFQKPPLACMRKFLGYAVRCAIPFPLVLHHMNEMTGKMEGVTKKARKRLMDCRDLIDLVDLVEEEWGLDSNVPETQGLNDN